MLGYILTFAGGFFVGTILTTILLCKKNLETYTQISNGATNSLSQNWQAAKAVYNAQINGEYDEDEEESDEDAELEQSSDEDVISEETTNQTAE